MYLRKRKKKGEGFTLIELLIVIVIIGILVSIALPNFKAAQDRAKNASLESNIRTLSMVAQTYTVDWGGNVAQDVNTLYNEATAKNYWKDLKNPFTGESGMGFAISNYSQAVSLITLLQGVKFATAVELASPMMKTTSKVMMIENQASYLGDRAVADMDYSKSAMNAVAATTQALPDASTVFGKPGAIVYLSVADDAGNFVILGSVPEKDNTGKSTGKPKFHTKGENLVMATGGRRGKIAMAQAHSGGGDYASKYGLKDPKLFGEIKNKFAEKTGLLDLQKNQAEVNKYKEDLYAKLKSFSGVDPALYDKQAETQKMLEATKNNIVTEQKKYEEFKAEVSKNLNDLNSMAADTKKQIEVANANGDTTTVQNLESQLKAIFAKMDETKKAAEERSMIYNNDMATMQKSLAQGQEDLKMLDEKIAASANPDPELVKELMYTVQKSANYAHEVNSASYKTGMETLNTYYDKTGETVNKTAYKDLDVAISTNKQQIEEQLKAELTKLEQLAGGAKAAS